MAIRYLKMTLVLSLFTLSACASHNETSELQQNVSSLDNSVTQLNQETVKIAQQNKLNAQSNRGVYLLPGSHTPARLNSQIGPLQMALISITPEADGTRMTLHIRGESSEPLPAFSAVVEWGQIQGTTDSYQEVNVQNQLIKAPFSPLAPSDIVIPLQLKGFTPQQDVFVRVHDIQPAMLQPEMAQSQ